MRSNCPVCGSADAAPRFSVGDVNQQMTPESFAYRRCAACASIFIADVPEDLGRYYGSGYSAYTWRDPALFEKMVEAERPKLEVVSNFARGGSLLEVGAAAGAFAVLASRVGFDVTAIEMDADSCTFMRTNGIRAIQSADVLEAVSGLPAFDVIALWHVLEHLPNPGVVFRALAGKLRPGGAFVVSTPNPASFQSRVFGRRWIHVDAPRHLALIPRPALDRVASSAGLSPARLNMRYGNDTQFDTYEWFELAFRRLFPASLRAHFVARVAIRALSYPAYAVTALLRGREGNTYTAAYVRDR